MTKAPLIISLLVVFSFNSFGQEVPVPENYSIIDTATGDLDCDGKKELVVAYNTRPEEDFESVPRELVIYQLKNGSWVVWKRSGQALYGSRDGGMMGDPFAGINIHNGVLLISHDGGSSWKWNHTDKYRYQNGALYLIGYTSNAGKLCEEWLNADFNLSTGKVVVKKEYENCENGGQEIYKTENEIFYIKGLRITLQNRSAKEIILISPRYKHEIYVAIEMK